MESRKEQLLETARQKYRGYGMPVLNEDILADEPQVLLKTHDNSEERPELTEFFPQREEFSATIAEIDGQLFLAWVLPSWERQGYPGLINSSHMVCTGRHWVGLPVEQVPETGSFVALRNRGADYLYHFRRPRAEQYHGM